MLRKDVGPFVYLQLYQKADVEDTRWPLGGEKCQPMACRRCLVMWWKPKLQQTYLL